MVLPHRSIEMTPSLFPEQVQINDYTHCNFCILNTGKFNFTFSWEFRSAKALPNFFTISPTNGTIEPGEQAEAVLSFHPLKVCTIKDIELKLQVRTTRVTGDCCLFLSYPGRFQGPTKHFGVEDCSCIKRESSLLQFLGSAAIVALQITRAWAYC